MLFYDPPTDNLLGFVDKLRRTAQRVGSEVVQRDSRDRIKQTEEFSCAIESTQTVLRNEFLGGLKGW
jgi:hypothetical protein